MRLKNKRDPVIWLIFKIFQFNAFKLKFTPKDPTNQILADLGHKWGTSSISNFLQDMANFVKNDPKSGKTDFLSRISTLTSPNHLIWLHYHRLKHFGHFLAKPGSILAFWPQNTQQITIFEVPKWPYRKTLHVISRKVLGFFAFCVSNWFRFSNFIICKMSHAFTSQTNYPC